MSRLSVGLLSSLLTPAGEFFPWRSYVVRQDSVWLSLETRGTSRRVQSNPRQLWGKREGNRVAVSPGSFWLLCQRIFFSRVASFIAYDSSLLVIQKNSKKKRERNTHIGLMFFPFPFVPQELFCLSSDDLLFVSNVGFPINGHPSWEEIPQRPL